MAKPLSMDLRERATARIEVGETMKSVASARLEPTTMTATAFDRSFGLSMLIITNVAPKLPHRIG